MLISSSQSMGGNVPKEKKDSKVPFPNQNQSSRNPRKNGSHRDGIIFGGACLTYNFSALIISCYALFSICSEEQQN